jgi:type II pantothenate kinase
LDIGGSLTKLAIFCAHGREILPARVASDLARATLIEQSVLQLPSRGGVAHLAAFATSRLDECLKIVSRMQAMQSLGLHARGARVGIPATGGGSVRSGDAFARAGLRAEPVTEMDAMAIGLDCLIGLPAAHEEVFCIDPGDPLVPCPPARAALLPRVGLAAHEGGPWPYVLASLGSGLSIVHVTAPAQDGAVGGEPALRRLGGSSVAGASLWGLGRLLAARADPPVTSFDQLLDLAERGESARADMTVGDIYGAEGCGAIGLDAAVPAASLGKLTERTEPADATQSLVWMVAWNAAQLAAVEARRLGVTDVYFGGNMCRGRPFALATIANSVKFNSDGHARAIFLRREGYLGALGALLESATVVDGMTRELRRTTA